MSRLLSRLLAVIGLYMLMISTGQTAVVSQLMPFTMISTTTGIVQGFSSVPLIKSLDPFDSSLGQLESVEVSTLFGTTSLSIQTGRSFFIDGFGNNIYMPYTLFTDVSLDIDGMTDYFRINPSLTGRHTSVATGVGEATSGVGIFDLGFTIDAASEALGDNRVLDSFSYSGGQLISIPFISGDRSDFLDTSLTSNLLLLSLNVSFLQVGGIPMTPTLITTTLNGLLQVDYIYTPAAVIPAPAAIWLFGTALIGFAGYSRRRKIN